ncbi:MAG TPA: hypothetical protein VNS31_06335 [Ramlibacter sp.]|jgi:hypothetical protein|nr:hypothetical protein [Ramlibacter sp.]
MRFAAVTVPRKPQQQRAPVAELMRRLVAGEPLTRPCLAEPEPQDLPADLDQRVRLVGEW